MFSSTPSVPPFHPLPPQTNDQKCLCCFETKPLGIRCNHPENPHFLCHDVDCLLAYAEAADTRARTQQHNGPLLVPCVGNTAVPSTCGYELSDFTRAVGQVGTVVDPDQPPRRSKDVIRRIADVCERYRSILSVSEGTEGLRKKDGGGAGGTGGTGAGGTRGVTGILDGADSTRSSHAFGVGSPTQMGQFDRYLHAIVDQLCLRCPAHACGKVLDPNPDGCAKVKCTHCRARFCWVCFAVGFSTNEQAYDHIQKQHRGRYFPKKRVIRNGHKRVRGWQLEKWLGGNESGSAMARVEEIMFGLQTEEQER